MMDMIPNTLYFVKWNEEEKIWKKITISRIFDLYSIHKTNLQNSCCKMYWLDLYGDIDKVLSKSWRTSKSHQWFKSYGHFTEVVDFAYWWSFSGRRSAPAACAAGLFLDKSPVLEQMWKVKNCIPKDTNQCNDWMLKFFWIKARFVEKKK